MLRISPAMVLLATVALNSGCALQAPRYTASLENIQKLKDTNTQTVKVGAFTATPGKDNANPISLRGSSLASPYSGSYAEYLAAAIKEDLSLAGKLAPGAQIEVSGALQKNDIDVGVGTGTGYLEARLVVTRSGAVRYDQVKSIHDEWESSFFAAVAIPRAQERYPVMMQKLLAALYEDPAFLDALK